MGIANSKIFNDECPICLDNDNIMINLKCGHIFHKFCLQKSFYSYIIENDNNCIFCPICRIKVSNNDIKKIFTKWEIINYNSTNWTNKNTIEINNQIIKKKISTINLDNNYKIHIPLFNLKQVNTLISVPLFFHSSILFNIRILDNENILSLIENSNNTFEEFKNFTLCLVGNVKNNDWYNFCYKNLLNLLNKNHEIFKDYSNSHEYMRFYVKNINDISTIDIRSGTIENELVIKKNRLFRVLFKMYILETLDNTFLINDIEQIMYL